MDGNTKKEGGIGEVEICPTIQSKQEDTAKSDSSLYIYVIYTGKTNMLHSCGVEVTRIN